MPSLRSAKTERIYTEFRKKNAATDKCRVCYTKSWETVKDYRYWFICINNFPYDRVYKVSHILFSKRCITGWKELNRKELIELRQIRDEADTVYDQITENCSKGKTLPNHFHLHCLSFKD